MEISNLYVDLGVVLSKRTTLGNILGPHEIAAIESRVKKNHWDDETVVAYVYRYLKENISELVDNSDFMDADVIVESDPYIIKAMQLMEASQRDAEKLLMERTYKYPGCWVNDIANALKGLKCTEEQREHLIWDAYYAANWDINVHIEGWENLSEVLENYYDTL